MDKSENVFNGTFVFPSTTDCQAQAGDGTPPSDSDAVGQKNEDTNTLFRLENLWIYVDLWLHVYTLGILGGRELDFCYSDYTARYIRTLRKGCHDSWANMSGYSGGPAGFVYGTLFIWLGMLTVYATLAELVSMAPTAGGQYHWVAMLAPPSRYKFTSYMAGWLTVLGWQAIVATAVAASAQVVQGLIKLTHPDYTQPRWHQLLIYWAVLAFAVMINALASTVLPKFEAMILILHIFGFFAILVPLLVLGEFQKPHDVFALWQSEEGYSSQGLSWLVGLVGQVFLFVGADGAVHMSEEIENATTVVPWSILGSVMLNGILAFAMLLAMLFVATDLGDALDSNTGYAFMAVYTQAVGSTVGATVMASLITTLQLFAVVACLAGCSRMTWSFARDRGLPGHKWLEKVDQRTSIPVHTVLTSSCVSLVLSFIILGSPTAFTSIISISFCGLFMSYWVVVSMILWRRLTGGIHDKQTPELSNIINTPGHDLVWGPWRMGFVLGTIVNSTALAFTTLVLFFMFWPPETPVTGSNMNYSILVTGSVLLFSMIWYAISARFVYEGPVVEHEALTTA